MKIRVLAAALSLLVMSALSTFVAQSSPQLSEIQALSFLRRINTAQAELVLAKGPYVSLEKLLQTPYLQAQQAEITRTDAVSGKWQNYKIMVLTSGDGKHYQAKLVPEQGCGPSYFSDETGVIYSGQALGCGAGR